LKRTNEKVATLNDSGIYSEKELEVAERQIYDYILSETMLKNRYKYDYDRFKDGQQEMRRIQPEALRKAAVLEKLEGEGKPYRGSYQW
jgi:hypothetical protein